MNALSNLAAQHWVVGGIAASLLWFIAGKQSLSNRKPSIAIGWMCVAVLIILILSGWAVASKEWLGLAASIVVLCVEVQAIRDASAIAKSADTQRETYDENLGK